MTTIEADARRYRWLKKADPLKLSAIAYRIPEACSHPAMDPDGCIDAALGVDGPRIEGSGRHITIAISNERAYQDTKYESIIEHSHCIGGWLTIMRWKLQETEEAMDADDVLREILQVIAVGHACLEQHGVTE